MKCEWEDVDAMGVYGVDVPDYQVAGPSVMVTGHRRSRLLWLLYASTICLHIYFCP